MENCWVKKGLEGVNWKEKLGSEQNMKYLKLILRNLRLRRERIMHDGSMWNTTVGIGCKVRMNIEIFLSTLL